MSESLEAAYHLPESWLRERLRENLPTATDEQIEGLAAVAERYGRQLRELREKGTGTHHAGVWSVNGETGECGCECSRCYVDDECICTDCTYDHDHSRRGIREAGFDA